MELPPLESLSGLTQRTQRTSPSWSATGSDSGETAVNSVLNSPSTSKCSIPECSQDFSPGDPLDLERPCHGWPDVAKVMADNPGFESFQVFRELHIKSLLYYQAELVILREDLHRCELMDHRKGNFEHSDKLCASVELLLQTKDGSERAKKQIETVNEMREVLKKYSDALLQYSQINELPEADNFNVTSLRRWLRDPKYGKFQITGPGEHTWGDLNELDRGPKPFMSHLIHLLRSLSIFWAEEPEKGPVGLVVPRKGKDVDGLTRWIANEWVPLRHSFRRVLKDTEHTARDRQGLPTNAGMEKRRSSSISTLVQRISSPFQRKKLNDSAPGEGFKDRPSSLVTYQMSGMRRFTSFVTTIVACLLPIVAIAVLATIHSQAKVLGFIALFTAIFAIGLMGFTNADASRTEIFTATAAFSAVLVVFVQNQNGGTNGS